MELRTCNRKNLCVDCDNAECAFRGKKEADCPKWTCDRPNQAAYHCDRCAFIDRFIDTMRKQK